MTLRRMGATAAVLSLWLGRPADRRVPGVGAGVRLLHPQCGLSWWPATRHALRCERPDRRVGRLPAPGKVLADEHPGQADRLRASRGERLGPQRRPPASWWRGLARRILDLDQEVKDTDKPLMERFRAHPQAKVIESLPGMGPILGAEFIVAVGGDLAAFRDVAGWPVAPAWRRCRRLRAAQRQPAPAQKQEARSIMLDMTMEPNRTGRPEGKDDDAVMTGLRVVLADDDVLLREGLASLLGRSGFQVAGQAGDGVQLLELVRDTAPDLVVVDIRMPPTHTGEGLEAARVIRQELPETGILVLSAHAEVEHAMELLASGRRIGYLLKSRVTDVGEFVDTLQRIANGGSVVDPGLVQELVSARRRSDPLGVLSDREREVLALMAEGRSNAGIARRLWVTEGTVEKHVRSILAKLSLPETNDDHRRVLAVLTFLEAR